MLCLQEDRVEEFKMEQWLPSPLEKVFAFFSNENNLEVMTPPWLKFEVLGKSTPNIEEGTLIDYRFKIHGFPARWQSRISKWEPNCRFVDEQIKGPYAIWEHTHLFQSSKGGTLIRDHLFYQVPLGGLGRVLVGWKVKKDLETIFRFRKGKLEELFVG